MSYSPIYFNTTNVYHTSPESPPLYDLYSPSYFSTQQPNCQTFNNYQVLIVGYPNNTNFHINSNFYQNYCTFKQLVDMASTAQIKIEENEAEPSIKTNFMSFNMDEAAAQELKDMKTKDSLKNLNKIDSFKLNIAYTQHRRNKQSKKQLEYVPNKSQKKATRRRSHQNQNRNIIPNQINQIISFIQKMNKSGHILAKIFEKYPPNSPDFSISRFYLYQSQLKQKLGHYTNENSLRYISQLYEPQCRVWRQQQQRYYNKLCRVLIHHFLHEDSIFIILTSRRMKSQKKLDHLKARRLLNLKVMQILRRG